MAEIATNVSGREVPTAIMVAPIIRGDIFILPANFLIYFRRKLAEIIKTKRDRQKITVWPLILDKYIIS